MKFRMSVLAVLAALGLVLSAANPAAAAGSYGGAGSTVTITTYNFYRTSFLPAPPSSVPAASTITSVSYTMSYTAPSFPPGRLEALMCTTLTNCTLISQFGGTTSYFNGLPATTQLQIRVRWVHPFLSGTVAGGVTVSDSINVSYN